MTEAEKQEVRWAPFLTFIDNKRYGTGYLDMFPSHDHLCTVNAFIFLPLYPNSESVIISRSSGIDI